MVSKSNGKTSPATRKSATEIDVDKQIGTRIRHVRVEIAGLDQRSFAARLGVTSPAVAQWELGKGATRANLDRVVAEFGISRDWLHTGEGSPYVARIVSELRLLPPEDIATIENMISFLRNKAGEQQAEAPTGSRRSKGGWRKNAQKSSS